MSRKFISLVLAAAVAVTGLAAAPARADEKDFARALAGIAALAIIAKALDEKSDRDRARRDDAYRQRETIPRDNHVGRGYGYGHRDDRLHPRPLPDRVSRKTLPGQCLFSVNTRKGERYVFGKRCLNHSYAHAHQLPRSCETRLRGEGKGRDVYSAGCLREHGYTLARR